ncbi:hypothetical protein BJ165DRAFT_1511001, partial [Panaeolus papilionaceus]
MLANLAITISLIGLVSGHGLITTPTPRAVGSKVQERCGAGAYKVLNSDKTAPIENAVAKIDSGYDATACPLFFCRGHQFDDNTNNVQEYIPGQQVHFLVDIAVRHTGTANVSIVNLATQTTIGEPLIAWPIYTNNSLGSDQWVKNETDFTVTIPTNLGTACQTAGACAIQWWWYAFNKQTYESCVDFVIV